MTEAVRGGGYYESKVLFSFGRKAAKNYKCYEPSDLFEMMERGMRPKIEMMRKYPDMMAFVIKAFYEGDTDIHTSIQESYQKHFFIKAQADLAQVKLEDFIPNLDLKMMYREMYLASEGYLWEIY